MERGDSSIAQGSLGTVNYKELHTLSHNKARAYSIIEHPRDEKEKNLFKTFDQI
jgi:hypothetical protein